MNPVIFVLSIAMLYGPVDGAAQQVGDLTVRVVDQTGGVLPHATIVLQPDSTGAIGESVAADETGTYAAKSVKAGKYIVTATADGFVPTKKTIEVKANQSVNVRLVLLVRHDELVKVPGLPIKLPNSLTGMTISGDALARLPTGEIDLLRRLMDMAGSRGRPGDVAIYVDGFRDFRRLPPKAAIDLIQINADPYSSEFSEPGTRRIEILTKPGAEGVYGQLKFDFNDDSLNAREALAISKPQLQRRTYSAYFSAPIIRQKWGYYLYAGRWEEDENAIIRATTLNSAFEPTSFLQTLRAPQRTTNLTANTGFALGVANRLKAEYSRDTTGFGNQGLEGGFALPERGYSVDTVVQAARFSLLSVWGSTAVYELRVQAKRQEGKVRASSAGTGIVVLDAFFGGANQDALHRDTTNDSIQVDSKFTKGLGKHTVKLGFQTDSVRLSQFDTANYGGTFVFGADVERDDKGQPVFDANGLTTPIGPLERYRRTLLEVPGYRPTLFTIASGNPRSQVRQWTANAFLQDDWVPTQNLNISLGVRAESQSNVTRKIDVAPRVGLTWALGAKGGVIRTGTGLFYTRLDPSLTLDTIRLDGQRRQEYVIQGPSFFPIPVLSDATARSTIMTKADGLRTGRTWVSNFGYERTLFGPLFASVTYAHERGERLTRLTDINAPLDPTSPRPVPTVGEILEFQSIGESRRDELQVGVRADFKSGSLFLVNYTYAKTRSNTDGPRTLPANPLDLAGEWGPINTDERHRVYVSGTMVLPGLWVLIPSVTYASPRPFNITTGQDNNRDGHLTDRPSFASPDDPSAISTPYGLLNPVPKPGETIIPRNFGRGSRVLNFDLSLAKVFALQDPARGQKTLALHIAAKNLTNSVNLRDYNGVLLSSTFGKPNSSFGARQISFGIGFTF